MFASCRLLRFPLLPADCLLPTADFFPSPFDIHHSAFDIRHSLLSSCLLTSSSPFAILPHGTTHHGERARAPMTHPHKPHPHTHRPPSSRCSSVGTQSPDAPRHTLARPSAPARGRDLRRSRVLPVAPPGPQRDGRGSTQWPRVNTASMPAEPQRFGRSSHRFRANPLSTNDLWVPGSDRDRSHLRAASSSKLCSVLNQANWSSTPTITAPGR